MTGTRERAISSTYSFKSSTDSPNRFPGPVCSESGPSDKLSKTSLWSRFLVPSFSIFETNSKSKKGCGKKECSSRSHGWTTIVKRVMNGSSMRRIQERVLGFSKTGITGSTSDIWLLGVCYKNYQEDSSAGPAHSDGYAAFVEDFSSRILMTYRKGFASIEDSNYTSDVNWGCMLRSSQMLVAQALLFHRLGRSWRKPLHKSTDQDYIEILHVFGDSEASPFSVHNLIQAGKAYFLAPGSWVGPYAMCRTWETLARSKIEETKPGDQSLPMAVYVVSGDEDGERGGAPVVCIEDASTRSYEFSRGQIDWTPILLLVPLVLGLDKVNPRYISLLGATFTFPQSLGILGGRHGASTYIVGVQDDKAFYLDPHEVQSVVDIRRENLKADTSSYHCNVVRHIPLDSIDPSLAIGFYCRDKSDFDDFCFRSSELAAQSNGAPLFTVTGTRSSPKPSTNHNDISCDNGGVEEDDSFTVHSHTGYAEGYTHAQEDDWQLL